MLCQMYWFYSHCQWINLALRECVFLVVNIFIHVYVFQKQGLYAFLLFYFHIFIRIVQFWKFDFFCTYIACTGKIVTLQLRWQKNFPKHVYHCIFSWISGTFIIWEFYIYMYCQEYIYCIVILIVILCSKTFFLI